ncbi:phosphopyruvate hydratase [Candidatus Uhrbacteria bacterium]|nr:phosphopyruvate hydratase [Candidatus Uhrbacteria bacterium]
MKIKKIHAQEILDSRGNPTVKVWVHLKSGAIGSASVPSGASTGIHEAVELRDGDKRRYGGKGVLKAVRNVNTVIARKVRGMRVTDLRAIDSAMIKLDGTRDKSRLGANAILGVSLACAHAGATAAGLPLYKWIRKLYALRSTLYALPTPTMNILNGGAHAGWILDFQEFMIVPRQRLFRERVRCGAEIFHALGALLKKAGYSTLKGDEGGYAVPFKSNETALHYILKAVARAGYKAGRDVALALDPAVSEVYDAKKKRYILRVDKKIMTTAEMITMWERWIKKYPIISLEDGLDQDDWAGWVALTKTLKHENMKTLLVGDDLFTTNAARLKKGIALGAANAILIKLNQIGTLTETMDVIALARKNGYKISVSHRSGETADTTIADLAVAVNSEFIKTGSLSRSERLAKYNRLLEIEQELVL